MFDPMCRTLACRKPLVIRRHHSPEDTIGPHRRKCAVDGALHDLRAAGGAAAHLEERVAARLQEVDEGVDDDQRDRQRRLLQQLGARAAAPAR